MVVLSEEFHVYLLLLHGGDPEPHLDTITDTYTKWRAEIRDTLREHQADSERNFDEYFAWLTNNGLTYRHQQENKA